MTGEDPDRDERELRALFDRTAETLDGPGATKLRARAADVPGAARRPWWWVFAPALAIAVGALLVVSLQAGSRSDGERIAQTATSEPSGPTTPESALAQQSIRPPSPHASEAPEAIEDEGDLENDVVAELDLSDDEGNGNDLFAALDEPADEDVDAWLEATSAFLEGG